MIKPGMFISDRYEIIEKVGSGGMADVYKARCHRLNRFVAIKILKPEYSDDKNFVLKFRAEAQSAAGLSHPNIVNVYDVGDDDGLYYIVMELVEGITLKSFIERKGKLEIREAVGIAIQIAQGLEAAHSNHIIHRDIKPQNIIISREGKVKVTDFGIAKAATSNTITSNAMGSVHYISPEQARGGYSDEKSDIYSLGITLYEMLSGMVPFGGDNTVSVALLHIQGEAMPLRQIDPNIPLSLERIVQKCMQKKPERRYLTAAELIADLKQSILNPNGDFVKLAPVSVDSSPTISISEEELNSIKKASKAYNDQMNQPYYGEEEKRTGPVNQRVNLSEEDMEEEDEEEDDSDIDPKLEKILFGIGIGICVVLVLIIFIFTAKTLGWFSGNDTAALPSPTPTIESTVTPTVTPTVAPTEEVKEAKVPNVLGTSLEAATLLLENEGFIVRYTEAESDDYEKGLICDQTPKAGEILTKGEVVRLVLCMGPKSFQVPDLTNKTTEEAIEILKDLKLSWKRELVYHDTIKEGNVVSTTPEKGASVKEGDQVTLMISQGPEIKLSKVPNLVSLSEEQAKKDLEDAGLKGNAKYVFDESKAGTVLSQETAAGEMVNAGTTITYTVSKGPEPVAKKYSGTLLLANYVTSRPDRFEGLTEFKIEYVIMDKNGNEEKSNTVTVTLDDIMNGFKIEGTRAGGVDVKVYVNGGYLDLIRVSFAEE